MSVLTPGQKTTTSDKVTTIVRHAQRFTRSSLGIVLQQGYSAKLDSAGMRSLESFGPAVWNSLPVDLRAISKYDSFKKASKHIILDNAMCRY